MKTTQQRRGVSLLELTAVVAVMGILFVVGMVRLGPDAANDTSARTAAALLAADMRNAQRRAIMTGDEHRLVFQSQGSTVISYQMFRVSGGSQTAVDDTRTFPSGLMVTSADSQLAFDFEGAAGAAYTVSFAGPERTLQVEVVPVTGAVRVIEP